LSWQFDIRTALILGAFLTLLIGIVLFIVRKHFAANLQPSLRWWIAATLLHPIGFMLIGLRDVISDWWTAVLANVLVGGSFAAFAIALRTFNGSPQRRERLYVLVAAVAGFAVYYTYVDPNLALRFGTISVIFAILLGSSARAIYRRGQPLNAITNITGGLFAAGTAVMSYRAALYLFGFEPVASIFAVAPMQVLAYAMGGLLPAVSTIGFLLMCTEFSQLELTKAARLDYLTGICNRRAIEDLAGRSIAAARRHGMPLAMMIIDVDHFKRINDEYGHEGGDDALIETVRRIRDSLRTEDLVGRLGGEEFVAVMPSTDGQSALAAAERIRSSFSEAPMRIGGSDITITVSVGVAVLDAQDQQYSHLLRRADRAMYAAKTAGRNKVMLDGVSP
jgi:diguanylate cyclase (GGDEF)-like protein